MFDYPLHETIDIDPQIVHEHIVESKSLKEDSWDIPLYITAKSHLSRMSNQELDEDWGLNDFFGTIAVINLPTSEERLKKITQELQDISTHTFTVFEGIDGRKDLDASIWNKMYHNRERIDTSTDEGKLALDHLHQGEAGCYMSHYTLIRQIKEAFDNAMEELKSAQVASNSKDIRKAEQKVRQYSRVLILEDDAAFGMVKSTTKISKVGSGLILRQALIELPTNWDMLYFIARPYKRVVKNSPHLYKLKISSCALAYAINHTMYNPIIEELKKIEDPEVTKIWPVDNAISFIHKHHKVFLISPSIVYHRSGKSEISSLYNENPWQGRPKE